jgi:hypothetical protein
MIFFLIMYLANLIEGCYKTLRSKSHVDPFQALLSR